jgi:hypothetical protein
MPKDRVETIPIEKALRSAMIATWDELSIVTPPRAIRVEYQCEPGVCIDNVTIWLVREGGYQERVCDYRTGHFSQSRAEWRCWAKIRSAKLVGALDSILRHQEHFLLALDARPNGLLVVFPPTERERSAAAVWLAEANNNNSVPQSLRVRARAATSIGVT